MIIEVDPVPKPRMTRSDKWKKRPCVVRYWEYKDKLRASGVKIGDSIDITFYIPMPKSWSPKKKKNHYLEPHKQKPDIDNLLKAFMDCILDEDESVFIVKAMKLWDYRGALVVK